MAGNFTVLSLFSKLSLLFFINLFLSPLIEGKHGFSTQLIHRDTPKSPLYNPSNSYFETLNKAFHRSFSRAEYFKKRISQSHSKSLSDSSDGIQSHITSISGEYLIKVSIGTPPVDILAIADTGSDLTWTQCNPCRQCYEQSAPLFDPSKTSSYRKLSCDSLLCTEVGTQTCDSENNCGYRVSYGDHSYSIGDLSVETFTFESSSGGSVSIPKVVFGCGHENEGTFNESASGIVGLVGGSLSIIQQLSGSISGRFSYCLVPKDSGSDVSSKINFGTNAVVSGPKAVSTPLIKKNPDTFYYLNLEGFSIGNTRISNKGFSKLDNVSATGLEEGNIIIDSGTTLTYVPQEFYQDLESQLSKIVRGTRVSDPLSIFGLCYKSERNIEFPKLVAHFTNADIVLAPTSTFLEVSEGMICLTIVPSDELAIFGNLLQINYLIGYDLINGKVSFLPADCTKN